MYKKPGYPKLVIDLNKLRNNIEHVRKMCDEQDVEIAGGDGSLKKRSEGGARRAKKKNKQTRGQDE